MALARLRPPAVVQDAALAVAVAAFQIRGTLLVSPGQHPVRSLSEPGQLGFLLLAASGLLLLGRRQRPTGVFIALAVVDTAYYLVGYPDGPGWVALFIALYTLTGHGDGHRSIRVAAVGITGLTVVWLLTADLQPLNGAGWVFFRIGAAVMAAALGESVRARVAAAAAAHERAEHDREEETRRRVDAERLRIAREVHDTVAHALAIINVHAGVTAHVLDRRPEQARVALRTVERTSSLALRELRSTVGMLREAGSGAGEPPVAIPGLAHLGLLAESARKAGLDVQLETNLDMAGPDLPGAVDHAAYRIVQESLTNAVRHAGPARVQVSIEAGPDEVEIRVVDDGHADGTAPSAGGHGLDGMRERAELLGGGLTAGPVPDGGFQVHARLPLGLAAATHP